MSKNNVKKYLGFPLEDQYRPQIEEQLEQSTFRMYRGVCCVILFTQVLMMLSTLLKGGGPLSSPRRSMYWWMYVALFTVSLAAILSMTYFHRKRRFSPAVLLGLESIYAAFVCFWGCGITLIDQLGGNGVSVYSYTTMSIAAFALFKPWQGLLVFGGSFVFLNTCLPLFPSGVNNLYSNLMNTLFIAVLAFIVSALFYRNRIFSLYDKLIIQQQMKEIQEKNQLLGQLVVTDELTRMYNRRYLEQLPEQDLLAPGQPVAAMMVDIDFFKQYNDTYGHQAGDLCLKNIAQVVLRSVSGKNAYAVRYGGEEFFILFPGCTPEQAKQEAEFLRSAVEDSRFVREDLAIGYVTISIGVCASPCLQGSDLNAIIRCSDLALYRAKERGRNCTVMHCGEAVNL